MGVIVFGRRGVGNASGALSWKDCLDLLGVSGLVLVKDPSLWSRSETKEDRMAAFALIPAALCGSFSLCLAPEFVVVHVWMLASGWGLAAERVLSARRVSVDIQDWMFCSVCSLVCFGWP